MKGFFIYFTAKCDRYLSRGYNKYYFNEIKLAKATHYYISFRTNRHRDKHRKNVVLSTTGWLPHISSNLDKLSKRAVDIIVIASVNTAYSA